MGTGFDEHAAEYDAWFLENKNVLYSEANLVASVLRDCGRILSVGCGSGLFEKILREEYSIEISEGIEPSEGMAAIARKRGMNVVQSTAEEADYGYAKYDTILFNGCPGYISDLGSVVKRVHDALPSGGRIILIDIPKESSYGILYNLAKAVGTWDNPMLDGVHPRNPYPIELVSEANWRTTSEKVEILRKAGFKDFEYKQTLTLHPLYSNSLIEQPLDGYDRGDYVAIKAYKR